MLKQATLKIYQFQTFLLFFSKSTVFGSNKRPQLSCPNDAINEETEQELLTLSPEDMLNITQVSESQAVY